MKLNLPYFLLIFLLLTAACTDEKVQNKKMQLSDSQAFRNYWYAGKAEINSYELQQAQYGNMNAGEAIMIFVTEDFRTDKQVKLESEKKENVTTVLKQNFIKKFVTGIYDYSMYSSIFTPVEVHAMGATLKVTTTTQEWCGQTFTQLNFRNNGYQVLGKSYFEEEVEDDFHIDYAMLEDEIWNKIRLMPENLPQGNVMLIPSTMSERLRHKKIEPEMAKTSLIAYKDTTVSAKTLMKYTIDYPASKRNLKIVFEKDFPHKIMGWEETYATKKKILTTKATLKATIMNPYWQKNTPIDTVYRKLLKLKY